MRDRIAWLFAMAWWCAACTATPLPVPPTADPDHVTVVDDGTSGVVVRGGAGAVSPGGTDIRVTWDPPPTTVSLPARVGTTVGEDGSFEVSLAGRRADRFFIEAITEDADLFLVAFTGGPGDTAVATDPGPDDDADGSPNAIDCAVDDPSLSGQRCP